MCTQPNKFEDFRENSKLPNKLNNLIDHNYREGNKKFDCCRGTSTLISNLSTTLIPKNTQTFIKFSLKSRNLLENSILQNQRSIANQYRKMASASSSSSSTSPSGNRLKEERSPYLLQHATNPVHWYPWGEEAFKASKEKNKMIFLSVGYSTCHWCHVMERESFESNEVLFLIYKFVHYVSIFFVKYKKNKLFVP